MEEWRTQLVNDYLVGTEIGVWPSHKARQLDGEAIVGF